ncbi:MAG TPA: ABC transporter substrate-binding protein [Pyrinomonadaceae bacterium]|nr:ABC transporter substrate-binding protein [Pyrinomonadaceae bacterium]
MKTRACLLLGVLLLANSPVVAQLTDSERRGKAIFLRGVSSSGREITGRIGEIEVPATTATCAGCHGMRGEGKTEGGVTAGGLTWPHLVKPYGHTHTTGRNHGPFNESSFIRAVVNGIDSNGNDLLVAMPRYKLSPEDMADLIAYLKRIESDLDPGLTDNSVTVGLVLPSSGAFAGVGAAMKDLFSAYFDNVNSRGGIFNRKIEMRIADAGTGGAATATVAHDFIRKEQIFAFVGGLSAGADAQIAAFARSEEVPFIGPATLLPHAENPANRYLFYLLPGVAEQAVSLVNFAAAKPELRKARTAIVYGDNSLGIAAATATQEQLQKIAWTTNVKQNYTAANFDARRIVDDLKRRNTEVLFFYGSGKDQSSLLTEAAAAGWSPSFFFIGVLSGKQLPPESLATFKDKLFVAFPTVPADITGEGMAEFRALHEKYKFAPRHTASQLSAFAAAKVFVEALTRAGKDLSREKLVNTLEGFYEYDTGATPRITFGPNRRVGAAGAHVVSIDVVEKEFAKASGWIKAY